MYDVYLLTESKEMSF